MKHWHTLLPSFHTFYQSLSSPPCVGMLDSKERRSEAVIGRFISPLERRAMIGSLIPGKWDSKRWQLICHRRTQKPFTNQTPFQQLKTFPSAPLSLFLSLSLSLTRIIKFIIISASVEPWIISHDRFQQGAAAGNKGEIRGERKRRFWNRHASTCCDIQLSSVVFKGKSAYRMTHAGCTVMQICRPFPAFSIYRLFWGKTCWILSACCTVVGIWKCYQVKQNKIFRLVNDHARCSMGRSWWIMGVLHL